MTLKKILWLTLAGLGAGVIYLFWFRPVFSKQPITSSTIDTMQVVPLPELLYDLPKDSFLIEEYAVGRNQNLSDILSRAGMEYARIHQVVQVTNPVFDVRRIRVGQPYTLFFTPDSLHELRHLVYAIDAREYLVCSFGDSLSASRKQKEVTLVERTAAAPIESSLWNAIAGQGLTPALAIELSEIFAWTVDFFGIEKGDYFKVIYTESLIDSVSVGIEQITAAAFYHRGKKYYAFRFEENGAWDYFDEKGNSLRKAFLKAPLKFSRISSRFSGGRLHPVLKIRRPHHGVDYAAPAGTPVYAIGDGRIVHKGWDAKGGGNYLKIKHNSVYTTVYMHLQGFAKGIAQGTQVRQGELIGFVGSTGLSTGPHLDFRVFRNDKPIDPLKMEAPSAEPVQAQYREAFLHRADSLQKSIKTIQLPNRSLIHELKERL